MGRLEGKSALITGAAAGIGQAAAVLFAREGAQVVVVDLDPKDGRETAERIRIEYGEHRALFVEANVTREEDCKRMVGTAVDRLGKLNILFNNAGIVAGGAIDQVSEEAWDSSMSVNVKSIYLGVKYAIPQFRK